MKPFFSIIVPVYNAERYLSEALDSIRGQSFEGWEIIAVNDGSRDRSGVILDEYVRLDKRIRGIHHRNVGVSAVRNRALSYVRGMYFTFLDSDDALTPDYLLEATKYTHDVISCPDILAFGLSAAPETFDWRTQTFLNTHKIVRCSNAQECFVHLWGSRNFIFSSANDKFWRTAVFGKKRFKTNLRIGEDTAFVWANSPILTSFIEVGYLGYFYRVNPASAMHRSHLLASLLGWYSRVTIVLSVAKSVRPREEWTAPVFGFTSFLWQLAKHLLPSRKPKTPLTFQMPPLYLTYLKTHRRRFGYWAQFLFRLSVLHFLRISFFFAYHLARVCKVQS